MVSDELITRLKCMLFMMPPEKNYTEKYLKKLKSEQLIKDYKYLGRGTKVNKDVSDILVKDIWYRVSFEIKGNKYSGLSITNLQDPLNPDETFGLYWS